MFPHFQKYLNPLVRAKKLLNSVFYHSCLSRLASGIRFFKLLRVLSLQNACWIFWIVIRTCEGKTFQFIVFTFLENHWIYVFLLMLQSLIQNSWWSFLKICFPHDRRSGRKLWFPLSKFNQKIWRWLGTLVLFPFGMIAFFLNVMA